MCDSTWEQATLFRKLLTSFEVENKKQMATPPKRPRNEAKDKKFYSKQARKGYKNYLDVGDKGFLVTCNFKEKDSIHECYRLLNEYYAKSQPAVEPAEVAKTEEDEDDISSQLQDQIEKSKIEVKERSQNFQSLSTGVQNCLFIRASIDDPLTLGTTIIRDLAETKVKKTKVTLRFLPIEVICRAKIEDMKDAAGILFDKHFLKEPSTFAINFNRRFSDMNRDEVIKELADIVALKNPGNKVNLNDPQKSVIVEIIKGHCLLSVVPDYIKLKKYNVNELWGNKGKDSSEKVVQESQEATVKEGNGATEEVVAQSIKEDSVDQKVI